MHEYKKPSNIHPQSFSFLLVLFFFLLKIGVVIRTISNANRNVLHLANVSQFEFKVLRLECRSYPRISNIIIDLTNVEIYRLRQVSPGNVFGKHLNPFHFLFLFCGWLVDFFYLLLAEVISFSAFINNLHL